MCSKLSTSKLSSFSIAVMSRFTLACRLPVTFAISREDIVVRDTFSELTKRVATCLVLSCCVCACIIFSTCFTAIEKADLDRRLFCV
ncbi:hypothetical protein EMIT0P100_10640 [Pseudomonas sp. IT-P100]